MTNVLKARLGLAIAGVALWGYGYRTDDSRVRMAGIGLLAVVLLLRFVKDDSEKPQ